jgi:tetratricopeptide (TPR) repeat protein
MSRSRVNILTTLNILFLGMEDGVEDGSPSPAFRDAMLAELERFMELPEEPAGSDSILGTLHKLFIDMEEETPSIAFTYAMLTEMARLVETLAADENEPPEAVIRAYSFMGEEYVNLRHFGFARECYLKALDFYPKCSKDIFEDEEMTEIFEEGCANLLKIYGKMGSYETADRIYGLIRDALPEKAESIHKQAMKKQHILYDTVEYTDEYLAILPELEAKIEAELRDVRRRHGFCFQYWHAKEEILERDYGIEWSSPSVLNPGVMFD